MKQFKNSINLLKLTTSSGSSCRLNSGIGSFINHHHHQQYNFTRSLFQLNNINNKENKPLNSSEKQFVISEDIDEPTPSSNTTNTTNTTNSTNNNANSSSSNNKNQQQRIKIINSSSNNNNRSSSSSKFAKTIKYSIIFTIASAVMYIIVESNNDRMNYYVSPSKVMDNRQDFPPDRKIRIGGIVKEGTIQHGENNFLTLFKITDLKYDIEIEYKGVLPDLFEENSTAICEGFMVGHSKLKCTNILAKHDQRNGMPPEIAYEVEKNRREMERRKLNQEQEEQVEKQ